MIPLTLIQMILIDILAISGFFAVLQLINVKAKSSYFAERFIWLIDLTAFVLYFLCCYIIGTIYVFTGYEPFVIYFFLVIGVGILLVIFVRYCYRNKDTMSGKHIVLFLIYFTGLLYVTLFTRLGSFYSGVEVMPFDDLQRAIDIGDVTLVKHMLLNIVLFIPFGYLIPSMNPTKLRKWSIAMLGGLIVSTLIEGAQLTVHLGECDIDDIIANTFGSVIGYILVRFVWRVNKNWKI